MTSRTQYRVPQRPEALQGGTGLPFWGERRPPQNFAEVFNATKATETVDDAAGSGTSASTKSVATLRLYGPIYDGWFGVSARAVGEALDELGDVDEVRVRINSPGGDAWEAMAILNMLRAHSATTVAVVDGVAASAASYLAAGCDRTVMSPGTQMMIHDASAFAYGPADVMLKAAAFLDSVSNSIAAIYADVAGGADDEWRALMRETTWYTAKEAVTSGLADAVAVVKDDGVTETAETEDPDLGESEVEDHWDLSMYPYAGRSQAPAPPMPPSASAVGSTPSQGTESAVAFSDEQMKTMRHKLGIAEDADEATILAALDEVLDEQVAEPTASTTTKVPDGMALVESGVLQQLKDGATAGVAAQKTLAGQERDRAINQALKDGKIAATSREKFVEAWDKDSASTAAILDALTPGLVPTNEVGHEDEPSAIGEGLAIDDAELEAFAASLGLSKEALHG